MAPFDGCRDQEREIRFCPKSPPPRVKTHVHTDTHAMFLTLFHAVKCYKCHKHGLEPSFPAHLTTLCASLTFFEDTGRSQGE